MIYVVLQPMNFRLPLIEEKVNRQQVIAMHLIVSFVLLVTGAFILSYRSFLNNIPADKRLKLVDFPISMKWGVVIALGGLLLLGMVVFKNHFLDDKKKNVTVRFLELIILLSFITYAIITSAWMPAVIYGIVTGAILFSIYWENATDNTLYIDIDEKGIRLPITSRRKTLAWWEIEQVLLRFSILTIDCQDNRLFQWNIRETELDKEKFEQFCKQQVTTNKEKRQKRVW
jgi:hypothetical protein